MSLSTEAISKIPRLIGLNPTCHVATWYWAAQTAQRAKLSTAKNTTKTIHNISAMAPLAAQQALIGLANTPGIGTWDFALFPSMPPVGSVLVWTAGATHSAVVTGEDQLHGYNQGAQLMNVDMATTGLTSGKRADIDPNCRKVKVIPEAIIVAEAARLNL